MYGCEAWTLNKQLIRTLEATEMWFYRRILKIPWTARQSNVDVLQQIEEQRQLIKNIRKRQAKFFWSCHEKRPNGTSGDHRKT